MMNQVDRIKEMESHLDVYTQAVEDARKAMELLKEYQERYVKLRNYYGSEVYHEDVDASNQGKLPEDLPCGVLGEDYVYDLMGDHRELALEMIELAGTMLRNW